MKGPLTIPVKEFLPILTFASGFTADKDIVPALRHIYFADDALSSYSGVVGTVCYTPWAFGDRFVLPAQPLLKIIASIHDQNAASVLFTRTDKGVTLKGGAFSGRLGCPVDEKVEGIFPVLPKGKKIALAETTFGEDLERVMFTVSQDETKPMLRGVYWSETGALVSTDAFRLSLCSPSKTSPKGPVPGGVLLPDHLLAALGSRRRDLETFQQTDNELWLSLPNALVHGRLLEATFPHEKIRLVFKDLEAALVRKKGTGVEVGEDQMLDPMLAPLLSSIADPPTFAVKVKFHKGGIQVACAQEGREGQVRLKATVTGPEVEFTMNCRHLLDALQRARVLFLGTDSNILYAISQDKRFRHALLLLHQKAGEVSAP